MIDTSIITKKDPFVRGLVTVYNVSYNAHISRMLYDIMRSVYKLVVYNHVNLVRIHHLVPMYCICHVHTSRRDYHDMISRSPIRMMRRNRS